MASMAGSQPGDSRDPRAGRVGGQLAEPPSARYATKAGSNAGASVPQGASMVAPFAKAAIAAVLGAAALVVVGAVLASTAGLLFVAGITGASIGLVLARARVPAGEIPPRLSRRAVTWLAVALALGAVAVAGICTWLIARGEGGTLGPIDYLLTTFGPFVPGEAILAALGAAWGAAAGPVER
jgi:hypothetical protein